MKFIFRIIGIVVVVAVLLAALLYFLNEKNVLKGPVSEWIDNVKANVFNIKDDTEHLIDQMKDSDDPIGDTLNTNGRSNDVSDAPEDQGAAQDTGEDTGKTEQGSDGQP